MTDLAPPARPSLPRRDVLAGLAALGLLAACGTSPAPVTYAGETPEMDALVAKYARVYDMPESLIHRVIRRESGYNPRARNGAYYGLMQIALPTAQTMGYAGPASGLLDAETNLIYAGKYLRGAWLVSHGSQDKAVYWYAHGYYYEAKKQGLLEETGLKA
jgi:soluble lytic murein transglycosylase-like protein